MNLPPLGPPLGFFAEILRDLGFWPLFWGFVGAMIYMHIWVFV